MATSEMTGPLPVQNFWGTEFYAHRECIFFIGSFQLIRVSQTSVTSSVLWVWAGLGFLPSGRPHGRSHGFPELRGRTSEVGGTRLVSGESAGRWTQISVGCEPRSYFVVLEFQVLLIASWRS